LAQKLIALTMPGVPDLYQGSELCEGSLADPDNRRPVDFRTGEGALALLDRMQRVPDPGDMPLVKLWITRQALHARRDHPEMFSHYNPLAAHGSNSKHLVAFDRGGAITLATRLPVELHARGGWAATHVTLPPGTYRDSLTGVEWAGSLELRHLLGHYPVALLLATEPE
jgi:(1->4)-alpha-D-glucan 1-alpha-D-glucosylmutase